MKRAPLTFRAIASAPKRKTIAFNVPATNLDDAKKRARIVAEELWILVDKATIEIAVFEITDSVAERARNRDMKARI